MPVTRNCEECGSTFMAYREHGRFCSTRCRVAWNRRQADHQPVTGNRLVDIEPQPVTGNCLADACLVDLIDELRERLTAMPPHDPSVASVASHHPIHELAKEGWINSSLWRGDQLAEIHIGPYGEGDDRTEGATMRADRVRVGDLLVSIRHPGTRVTAVDLVDKHGEPDKWVRLTVRRPNGETVTRAPVPPDWPVDVWPDENENDVEVEE